MEKIFAGILVGAIIIILLASISFSPVSASSESSATIVSFGIQEQKDIAKQGITTISGNVPHGKYDTKTIRIRINISECSIHPADDYVYLKVGELKPFTKSGEPQLPMQTHIVKLPKNAEVIGVAISNLKYRVIENKLNIIPVPQPVIWSENAKIMPEIIPDEKVYGLDTYFPGRAVSYDTGCDNEYKYVFVRFYPLQYIPIEKKAILITDATINVYYKDEDKDSEFFFLTALFKKLLETIRQVLRI